jgi:hypothetical protein
LAYYKLAVILEGIHYRFTQGLTPDGAFSTVGDAVEPLIECGLAAMTD